MSKQPRASRISGWQPIGLATPLTTNADPRVFVHDLSLARARRTARTLVAPGVVLAATLGMASTAAAHDGLVHTSTGDVPVAVWTAQHPGEPVPDGTVMTTSTSSGGSMTTTSTSTTSSPVTGLGGGELPGSNLPVAGKFIANAPKIFSGGLLGGKPGIQTSVPRPAHTAHSQGGDACDFFLEHMWKNEDGIPVIGTNTHFLTYHTDAEYKNLILSLFSGAIGNSQMPIVDLYGGPLGWIPIFNPKHVEGHGTDYATMLTGCGGMGLPIDLKTGAVNLDRIPTPEKVMTFAQRVIPNIPDPQKILAPDYLYNTLAVDEITDRLGFNTVFTPDEYLSFLTNNADAFRTLATTAFEPLASGDPTKVLEVLQATDNLKTLESLGLPGFSSLLGPIIPQAGTTQTVTIDGKTYPVRNGKVTLDNGAVYTAQGGTVTIDGKQYPVNDTTPKGGLTGALPTGDLPVVSDLLKGGLPGLPGAPGGSTPGGSTSDSPLSSIPVLGGLLGGGLPGGTGSTPTTGGTGSTPTTGGTGSTPTTGGTGSTPTTGGTGSTPTTGGTGSTPTTGGTGSTPTTGGSTPTTGSTTPTTGGTAGTPSPTSSLPVVGDLLGGSSPLGTLPVVGSLLGGSATAPTTGGSTTPTTGGTGSTPTGGSTTPTTGGSTTPTTGGTGSTPTTGGTSPIDTPHGTVAFAMGAAKVNGQSSPNAPGVTVPAGQQVTFTVPVTNTGDVPLTTLVGKASDGGTMTGAQLPLAPGRTTTLTYTTTAKPGTQALSFGIVGSNPNGQQQGKTCSAVYTGSVQHGQIATTGGLEVDDQPTNDSVRYTFHSTDVSRLEVQVTNHGDAPLQNITATSPAGPVTGGKTTLQPGESTWFSVPIAPKSGINTVPVSFTGTDPTGKVTTAQERFEYTLCTCAASTTAPQA